MKKIILALVFLSAFVGPLAYGQQAVITPNQFEAKGDDAYERKDYNAALANYMSILNDDPERADLYWRAAECARLTRHFKTAEFYYEALSKKPELSSTQPLLDFKLASVKKNLEKYDAAIAIFQRYTTSQGPMASEAASEIKQIKWAQSKIQEKRTYEVQRLQDNTKVNTVYIDAAPVQYGSTLYYTTGLLRSPEEALATEQQNVYNSNLVRKPKEFLVTNVFAANLKDQPKALPLNSTAEGVHTAYYAPNTEGTRLYYNLCEQTDSGSFNCKIYVREKGADGTWDRPRILDATINAPGFTATQPNVGFDKAKGKDVLYFVSDRKNGSKGGLDIWAADIEQDGSLSTPVNLPINTAKDDITPFFIKGPQILLFSTEGDTTESFGGFDIFKSELLSTGFGKTENLGYPMNSSYDDMYASFTPESSKYYFVSNRPGGLCATGKNDCVCNDIYDENIKVTLDVSTFLAEGGKELTGCRIDLVDIETGKIVTDINPNGNGFNFPIDPNKKYRLIATKKGYQSDTINFNTMGLYLPVTAITQKMHLKPNLKMQVYVFDKIDRKALDGSTVEIRSEDGSILYATETLKGNMMTWEGLEFGKTYLISAIKETYGKDFKKETIERWSSTLTKFVYKDSLYLTPFSGLPLTLYYDNDYPDPRSRKMITIYTYGETFTSYYSKQTEYLNAYYKDNRDVSATGANEISEFFQNKVKFGYDKLNDFSNKLVKYLKNDQGMEIVLEGYASPLAETEYNRILTSRRVSAVINHFYKYNGGIFRQFIKNGQLRLRVEPYGEDKADKGVSDNAQDRRRSVYSVAAMKERKVEIKEINVFQYDKNSVYNINEALGIYFDMDEVGKGPKRKTTLADVDAANDKGKKGRKGSSSSSSKASIDPLSVGYAKDLPVAKTTGKQQRREIVFVDSYSGEVINNEASVELFDQYTDKMVGKAKRKGKSYYYNVDLTKDYLVKGSSGGYSEATVSKYSNIYTEGGTTVTADTMYLTPFSGLPLPLYFDNDKPAGGTSETTTLTYDATYRPYIIRKRDFVTAYDKMMDENGGMIVPENSMNKFFDSDIKGGYDRLVGFSNILKTYLQRGAQLEIIIEGYASPLANSEYNQRLSSRRVNTVVNYFTSFGGGSLKKYIKSGQLKISIQPHGEVNTTISDDIKNISSVYSIEASRERKVVIKDIVILNNNFYGK